MTSACDKSATGTAGGGPAEVDLPRELEAEIREFARVLPTLDYYAVLGIERDADDADVRDGFFDRSRRFHPDRYFNKKVGPYGPLLNEIYKRVVAAYDVLRDPKLRAGYDRTLGSASTPAPSASWGARGAAASRPAEHASDPGRGQRGPSLRARKGVGATDLLGGLQARLESSRAKAQRHLEEALEYQRRGDWRRSAAALRDHRRGEQRGG